MKIRICCELVNIQMSCKLVNIRMSCELVVYYICVRALELL
jgi:hypothetical protein